MTALPDPISASSPEDTPLLQPGSIILASASPRRRRLLDGVGCRTVVVPSRIVETRMAGERPRAYASRLCRNKAEAVLLTLPHRAPRPAQPEAVVLPLLAADTIVHQGAEIFEKPTDTEDALRILSRLSGAWHEVTTAFCVTDCGLAAGAPWLQRTVTTRVRFRDLGRQEILHYIASGEPLDKAGAYGIQGRGGALVREIEGSYTNVVGLPLHEVLQALRRLGWSR